MTECNRKSLSFSSPGRQKIIANFDGGRLTTDVGGLLLREGDRRLGLTASRAQCASCQWRFGVWLPRRDIRE